MDLLVAADSVDLAHADAPPVGGTAQYATDGNPATNTPATVWPSYWFNGLARELMAILTAGAVAPDRTVFNQLLTALQNLFVKSPPTFGEIGSAGSGNITIPAGARGCLIEFTGGGGGGGTGDGGAGGTTGTFQNGANGTSTTINGVTAAPGNGGIAGQTAGNTLGGLGGTGGAGTGSSYQGQPGNCGIWTSATALGNIGGNGGKSQFGCGGQSGGNQAGTKGGGGAGGKSGNSGTFTGAGGGAGETRRIFLNAAALAGLGGNIAYSIGPGGAGGVLVGNFPGGVGGDGYARYQFTY